MPEEPQSLTPQVPNEPQQTPDPASPQSLQPTQPSALPDSGFGVSPTPSVPTPPTSVSSQDPGLTSTPEPTSFEPSQTPSVIGPSFSATGPFTPDTPAAQTPSVMGPMQPGGTGSFVPNPPMAEMPLQPGKSKKLLVRALVAVVGVLLLGAAYVFAFYLPNTPSHVYSASLANSGIALDKLIDYSKVQAHANYKSVSLDGTVHVKSPSGSYDVTLSGAANKGGNADLHFNEDALGEKFSTDVLSILPSGDTTPDIYVKVTGVKHFLDGIGLNSLDYLDGQWIVIDHTLIDTYISNLKKSVGSSNSSNTTVPTYDEVQDALSKAQAVNKQYIFTTDSSRAVLTNEKFIGRETVSGRAVDHYKVGYNKAHLEAYVSALASALDSSKLNGWSKNVNGGKSLSDSMGFSPLEKSVKNANGSYTFDMWADTKTKLISKLTFTDPSDKSSIFTVTQGYNGGSKYPFGLSVSGKDSTTNDPQTVTLNATLDTSTNKLSATFSSSSTASDGTTTSTGNFNLTPNNNTVNVTAPAKAKSLTDLLISLGLGDLVKGSPQSTAQTQSTNPFSITE